MNWGQAENELREGLERLISDVTRGWSEEITQVASAAGGQTVSERVTRANFLDRFFELLGWDLSIFGTVRQEVQIGAGRTRFMDYLGIKPETRAPVLMIEAKPWNTPMIALRRGRHVSGRHDRRELLVAALRHLFSGGAGKTSPVTTAWHDHLNQITGYVRDLHERYGHKLPRAVLSSGQWTIVFTNPPMTFLQERAEADDVVIVELPQYAQEAGILYDLIGRERLGPSVPFSIRPAQIRDYISAKAVSGVFYGLHLKYEKTGTNLHEHSWPRILIYPAVIVRRDDGAMLAVMDTGQPMEMEKDIPFGIERKSLDTHFKAVTARTKEIIKDCSRELESPLCPSGLEEFPGFSEIRSSNGLNAHGRHYVKPFEQFSNEWLLATGKQTHYLLPVPEVNPCRFHSWELSLAAGVQAGPGAINTSRTERPRSFFTDREQHHCAPQAVLDRRASRCHIAAIDQRTCCRACVYQDVCWTSSELHLLPCGK